MVDANQFSADLARECGMWSRYLVDREPSAFVVARYTQAHAQGIVDIPQSQSAFDRALVRVARGGAFLARVCDVHARIFRPAGLLRRKLVLTLALLETDRESHARVDQVSAGSRSGLTIAVCLWILRFALIAVLGIFLLFPLRLFCAFGTDRARPA
jgi:hypothetical protein